MRIIAFTVDGCKEAHTDATNGTEAASKSCGQKPTTFDSQLQ